MKSIFEKLYDGDIRPAEEIYATKEYRRNYKVDSSEYDRMSKELEAIDSELRQRFSDCMEHQAERFSIETPAAFAYGFRLGAQIMIEILFDRNDEE